MPLLVMLDQEAVDLVREAALLRLLAELGERAEALGLPSRAADLAALLATGALDAGELAEKLAGLGIDIPDVPELLERFAERYRERLPEELARLLTPYAELQSDVADAGLVRWEVDRSWTADHALGPVGIDLSAAAEATIDVEADDEDRVGAFSYLRLGVAGQARAAVGADLPLPAGAFGLSAEGEAALKADYWFAVPDDERSLPLGAVAATRLPLLPAPHDLLEIIDAVRAGELTDLEFSTRLDHAGALDMKFDVARSLAPLEVGGSIEFEVRAKRGRDFMLTLEADPGSPEHVRFVVERRTSRSEQTTLSTMFGIDASKVLLAVRDQLKEHVEGPLAAFYDRYEAYLTPGELLREHLDALVAEQGSLALRLAAFLDGETRQEALDRIEQALLARIEGHLDLYQETAQEQVGEISKDVAEALQDRFPGLVDDDAVEQLGEVAGDLLARLRSDLDARVAQEVDGIANGIAHHAAELQAAAESFGTTLSVALDDLEKVTAAVRDAIVSLRARIVEIGEALEAAARQRLTLRITDEETRSRQNTCSFEFEVSEPTAAARELFGLIVRGDYARVLEKIDANDSDAGDGYRIARADLQQLMSLEAERTVELGLFGLSMGEKSIFHSEVKVDRDMHGNVVVDASGSSKRRTYGLGEAQQATFLSQTTLWSARRSGFLSAALTVMQEDDDLRSGELERFLGAFSQLGLLSASKAEQAQAQLASWRGQAGNASPCTVSVHLGLDAGELETLFESATDLTDVEALELTLDAMERSGMASARRIDRTARDLRNLDRSLRRYAGREVFLGFRPNLGFSRGRRALTARFDRFAFGETNSAKVFRNNRDLARAQRMHFQIKGFQILVAQLKLLSELDPRDPDVREQAAQMHAMVNFVLGGWLKVDRRFLMLPSDTAAEETIALMLLLSTRAGIVAGIDPPLTVRMLRSVDGRDEEVVL